MKHTITACSITLVFFTLVTIWGLSRDADANLDFYGLIVYDIIMPAVSFLAGVVLGVKKERIWWVYPVYSYALGVITVFAISKTFNLAFYNSGAPPVLGWLVAKIYLSLKKEKGRKQD
ncbi:MAG: hypothetical protein LBU36_00595 [Clostridiales bacterium]|jgi:hypothetical protein|nr:hypothetical protein [Clostridiales bacterium]